MKNKSQKHKKAFFRFISHNCAEKKITHVYQGTCGKPKEISMNVRLFVPDENSWIYGFAPNGFAVQFGKKNRIQNIYIVEKKEKNENGKSH